MIILSSFIAFPACPTPARCALKYRGAPRNGLEAGA
jgi:hypothetical protein